LWEWVGLVTSHEQEFVEFAAAPALRLRRAAFLLCGDWHTAEDLAQTGLAEVFVSWREVRRQDAAHAHAHPGQLLPGRQAAAAQHRDSYRQQRMNLLRCPGTGIR
jgi:hypothetical protein